MISREDLAPPASNELITVVGPTASGKTDLAVALARRWGGEVVSADSVQIYREFDVGSGKPTLDQRAGVPHHLIDALHPLDAIDARAYAMLADQAIAEIRRRGRVPVVCGGTFLWIKALVLGLADTPPADPAIRAKHAAIVAAGGREALHSDLRVVDPATAARLAPNDFVRVSRALEVFQLTGRPLSAWHAEHGFSRERYHARLVGVAQAREDLDRRIAARVASMLDRGWVEEVRLLIGRGYLDARAMASVGYKQVRAHVEGSLPQSELEGAIVRATRVFARRQRTWLRDQPVTWVVDSPP
jgi:tRNA dimethylallyltransferase